MKTLDIIASVLLVIGGLNLGLIGFFGFDLIGMIFSQVYIITRIIYAVIGISALYYIFQCKQMQRRWKK